MSCIVMLLSHISLAQNSLSNILDKEINDKESQQKRFVYATFKGTHLVNANTIETIKKKELDFRVAHRFGDIGGEFGGEKRFFGLDNSTDIKISFDYGISNRLSFGIGRAKGATAVRQLYEASMKFKLIRQSENGGLPITVTAKVGRLLSCDARLLHWLFYLGTK